MAILLAGLPISVPGTTVNRLCGSGMDAVGMAARAIRSGDCEFVIAGGVESMSRAPFVMPKADAAFSRANAVYDTTIGWRFVNPKMKSPPSASTRCRRPPTTSPPISRFPAPIRTPSLRSQQRWAKAQAAGVFRDEIVPLVIPQKKGDPIVVDTDEHPRPDATLAQLAKLGASTARSCPSPPATPPASTTARPPCSC